MISVRDTNILAEETGGAIGEARVAEKPWGGGTEARISYSRRRSLFF